MINDNYLVFLAQRAIGESTTMPGYLAFGSTTGVLGAADTTTSGEFYRIGLDSSSRSGAVAKFSGVRTSAVAANETINVISLCWSSSLGASGNIYANVLIPSLIQTTTFDVDMEFWFDHQRG